MIQENPDEKDWKSKLIKYRLNINYLVRSSNTWLGKFFRFFYKGRRHFVACAMIYIQTHNGIQYII